MPVDREKLYAQSGRALDELTMEAVLAQRLTEEDFRISADTLRLQAKAAEDAGYAEVAQNLRRAAELTRISNQEVLDIYASLRPGRTSYAALTGLAKRLRDELEAPLTAELVLEAAEAYAARSLVEP
jgi:propanediol dehydratase small subunit